MKRILLFFLISAGIMVNAQLMSGKEFQSKINAIEQAKNAESIDPLIHFFENPSADTSNWEPAYYASYASLKQAQLYLRNGNSTAASNSIKRAEKNFQSIIHLLPTNSEIRVLNAYLNISKISANTSGNNEMFIKEAKELLYLKKNVDAANPRMQLMRAQLNYVLGQTGKNLQAQFENAETALKKFKPQSNLDPNWGLTDAAYYKSKLSTKTAK